MFLVKWISAISNFLASQTLEPTQFDKFFMTISQQGKYVLMIVINFITELFYHVVKWLLAFTDFLQYFIQKMIGLDYWLNSPYYTLSGATSNDILFKFLFNSSIQRTFRALCAVGLILLIIFTIFSIIKSEWAYITGGGGQSQGKFGDGSNSKTQVIRNAIKAIALVITFPIILIMGIVASDAILASIVKALQLETASTFGATLFAISTQSANRYRNYSGDSRLAITDEIVFYTNSNNQYICFSDSNSQNKFQRTYSSYAAYMDAIKNGTRHKVNSMFTPLSVNKDTGDFSGYCIGIDVQGETKYYLVKKESGINDESLRLYLANVLRARVMTKTDNIGNSGLLKELKSKMNGKGYISGLTLQAYGSGPVRQAALNTWGYPSIFATSYEFDETLSYETISAGGNDVKFSEGYKKDEKDTASLLSVLHLDNFGSVKLMYNSDFISSYFDGGQFGLVQLQSEYAVMADVVDFMTKNDLDLYMMNISSSLINWNYSYRDSDSGKTITYAVSDKWVGGIDNGTSSIKTTSDFEDFQKSNLINSPLDNSIPFVVSYSDAASEIEAGNILYTSKANAHSEKDGAKFIVCYKVTDGGYSQYIPLINKKVYQDPVTGKRFQFRSDYYTTNYDGVVLAKGVLESSFADGVNGSPTYIEETTYLDEETKELIDVNGSYYYNLNIQGGSAQYATSKEETGRNFYIKQIEYDPNYDPENTDGSSESDMMVIAPSPLGFEGIYQAIKNNNASYLENLAFPTTYTLASFGRNINVASLSIKLYSNVLQAIMFTGNEENLPAILNPLKDMNETIEANYTGVSNGNYHVFTFTFQEGDVNNEYYFVVQIANNTLRPLTYTGSQFAPVGTGLRDVNSFFEFFKDAGNTLEAFASTHSFNPYITINARSVKYDVHANAVDLAIMEDVLKYQKDYDLAKDELDAATVGSAEYNSAVEKQTTAKNELNTLLDGIYKNQSSGKIVATMNPNDFIYESTDPVNYLKDPAGSETLFGGQKYTPTRVFSTANKVVVQTLVTSKKTLLGTKTIEKPIYGFASVLFNASTTGAVNNSSLSDMDDYKVFSVNNPTNDSCTLDFATPSASVAPSSTKVLFTFNMYNYYTASVNDRLIQYYDDYQQNLALNDLAKVISSQGDIAIDVGGKLSASTLLDAAKLLIQNPYKDKDASVTSYYIVPESKAAANGEWEFGDKLEIIKTLDSNKKYPYAYLFSTNGAAATLVGQDVTNAAVDPDKIIAFQTKTNFFWDHRDNRYDLYDGKNYVATVYKELGVPCPAQSKIPDVSVNLLYNNTTYYNVRNQNTFDNANSFKDYYNGVQATLLTRFKRTNVEMGFQYRFVLFYGPFTNIFDLKLSLAYKMERDTVSGTYFKLNRSMNFDYFFENASLTKSDGGIRLSTFFVPMKISYWVIIIASILIIKVLSNSIWGVIKRMYEITLYFLAMPVMASTIPLGQGGGDRFTQAIQKPLIDKVLSTYGVIIGLNVFFILLIPIRAVSQIFTAADIANSGNFFLIYLSQLPGMKQNLATILNEFVYILFMLVAFTMIEALPQMIDKMLAVNSDGGGVMKSGEQAKKQSREQMKNAARDFTGASAMGGISSMFKTAGGAVKDSPGGKLVGLLGKGANKIKEAGKKGSKEGEDENKKKESDAKSKVNKKANGPNGGGSEGGDDTAASPENTPTPDGPTDGGDGAENGGQPPKKKASDLTEQSGMPNASPENAGGGAGGGVTPPPAAPKTKMSEAAQSAAKNIDGPSQSEVANSYNDDHAANNTGADGAENTGANNSEIGNTVKAMAGGNVGEDAGQKGQNQDTAGNIASQVVSNKAKKVGQTGDGKPTAEAINEVLNGKDIVEKRDKKGNAVEGYHQRGLMDGLSTDSKVKAVQSALQASGKQAELDAFNKQFEGKKGEEAEYAKRQALRKYNISGELDQAGNLAYSVQRLGQDGKAADKKLSVDGAAAKQITGEILGSRDVSNDEIAKAADELKATGDIKKIAGHNMALAMGSDDENGNKKETFIRKAEENDGVRGEAALRTFEGRRDGKYLLDYLMAQRGLKDDDLKTEQGRQEAAKAIDEALKGEGNEAVKKFMKDNDQTYKSNIVDVAKEAAEDGSFVLTAWDLASESEKRAYTREQEKAHEIGMQPTVLDGATDVERQSIIANTSKQILTDEGTKNMVLADRISDKVLASHVTDEELQQMSPERLRALTGKDSADELSNEDRAFLGFVKKTQEVNGSTLEEFDTTDETAVATMKGEFADKDNRAKLISENFSEQEISSAIESDEMLTQMVGGIATEVGVSALSTEQKNNLATQAIQTLQNGPLDVDALASSISDDEIKDLDPEAVSEILGKDADVNNLDDNQKALLAYVKQQNGGEISENIANIDQIKQNFALLSDKDLYTRTRDEVLKAQGGRNEANLGDAVTDTEISQFSDDQLKAVLGREDVDREKLSDEDKNRVAFALVEADKMAEADLGRINPTKEDIDKLSDDQLKTILGKDKFDRDTLSYEDKSRVALALKQADGDLSKLPTDAKAFEEDYNKYKEDYEKRRVENFNTITSDSNAFNESYENHKDEEFKKLTEAQISYSVSNNSNLVNNNSVLDRLNNNVVLSELSSGYNKNLAEIRAAQYLDAETGLTEKMVRENKDMQFTAFTNSNFSNQDTIINSAIAASMGLTSDNVDAKLQEYENMGLNAEQISKLQAQGMSKENILVSFEKARLAGKLDNLLDESGNLKEGSDKALFGTILAASKSSETGNAALQTLQKNAMDAIANDPEMQSDEAKASFAAYNNAKLSVLNSLTTDQVNDLHKSNVLTEDQQNLLKVDAVRSNQALTDSLKVLKAVNGNEVSDEQVRAIAEQDEQYQAEFKKKFGKDFDSTDANDPDKQKFYEEFKKNKNNTEKLNAFTQTAKENDYLINSGLVTKDNVGSLSEIDRNILLKRAVKNDEAKNGEIELTDSDIISLTKDANSTNATVKMLNDQVEAMPAGFALQKLYGTLDRVKGNDFAERNDNAEQMVAKDLALKDESLKESIKAERKAALDTDAHQVEVAKANEEVAELFKASHNGKVISEASNDEILKFIGSNQDAGAKVEAKINEEKALIDSSTISDNETISYLQSNADLTEEYLTRARVKIQQAGRAQNFSVSEEDVAFEMQEAGVSEQEVDGYSEEVKKELIDSVELGEVDETKVELDTLAKEVQNGTNTGAQLKFFADANRKEFETYMKAHVAEGLNENELYAKFFMDNQDNEAYRGKYLASYAKNDADFSRQLDLYAEINKAGFAAARTTALINRDYDTSKVERLATKDGKIGADLVYEVGGEAAISSAVQNREVSEDEILNHELEIALGSDQYKAEYKKYLRSHYLDEDNTDILIHANDTGKFKAFMVEKLTGEGYTGEALEAELQKRMDENRTAATENAKKASILGLSAEDFSEISGESSNMMNARLASHLATTEQLNSALDVDEDNMRDDLRAESRRHFLKSHDTEIKAGLYQAELDKKEGESELLAVTKNIDQKTSEGQAVETFAQLNADEYQAHVQKKFAEENQDEFAKFIEKKGEDISTLDATKRQEYEKEFASKHKFGYSKFEKKNRRVNEAEFYTQNKDKFEEQSQAIADIRNYEENNATGQGYRQFFKENKKDYKLFKKKYEKENKGKVYNENMIRAAYLATARQEDSTIDAKFSEYAKQNNAAYNQFVLEKLPEAVGQSTIDEYAQFNEKEYAEFLKSKEGKKLKKSPEDVKKAAFYAKNFAEFNPELEEKFKKDFYTETQSKSLAENYAERNQSEYNSFKNGYIYDYVGHFVDEQEISNYAAQNQDDYKKYATRQGFVDEDGGVIDNQQIRQLYYASKIVGGQVKLDEETAKVVDERSKLAFYNENHIKSAYGEEEGKKITEFVGANQTAFDGFKKDYVRQNVDESKIQEFVSNKDHVEDFRAFKKDYFTKMHPDKSPEEVDKMIKHLGGEKLKDVKAAFYASRIESADAETARKAEAAFYVGNDQASDSLKKKASSFAARKENKESFDNFKLGFVSRKHKGENLNSTEIAELAANLSDEDLAQAQLDYYVENKTDNGVVVKTNFEASQYAYQRFNKTYTRKNRKKLKEGLTQTAEASFISARAKRNYGLIRKAGNNTDVLKGSVGLNTGVDAATEQADAAIEEAHSQDFELIAAKGNEAFTNSVDGDITKMSATEIAEKYKAFKADEANKDTVSAIQENAKKLKYVAGKKNIDAQTEEGAAELSKLASDDKLLDDEFNSTTKYKKNGKREFYAERARRRKISEDVISREMQNGTFAGAQAEKYVSMNEGDYKKYLEKYKLTDGISAKAKFITSQMMTAEKDSAAKTRLTDAMNVAANEVTKTNKFDENSRRTLGDIYKDKNLTFNPGESMNLTDIELLKSKAKINGSTSNENQVLDLNKKITENALKTKPDARLRTASNMQNLDESLQNNIIAAYSGVYGASAQDIQSKLGSLKLNPEQLEQLKKAGISNVQIVINYQTLVLNNKNVNEGNIVEKISNVTPAEKQEAVREISKQRDDTSKPKGSFLMRAFKFVDDLIYGKFDEDENFKSDMVNTAESSASMIYSQDELRKMGVPEDRLNNISAAEVEAMNGDLDSFIMRRRASGAYLQSAFIPMQFSGAIKANSVGSILKSQEKTASNTVAQKYDKSIDLLARKELLYDETKTNNLSVLNKARGNAKFKEFMHTSHAGERVNMQYFNEFKELHADEAVKIVDSAKKEQILSENEKTLRSTVSSDKEFIKYKKTNKNADELEFLKQASPEVRNRIENTAIYKVAGKQNYSKEDVQNKTQTSAEINRFIENKMKDQQFTMLTKNSYTNKIDSSSMDSMIKAYAGVTNESAKSQVQQLVNQNMIDGRTVNNFGDPQSYVNILINYAKAYLTGQLVAGKAFNAKSQVTASNVDVLSQMQAMALEKGASKDDKQAYLRAREELFKISKQSPNAITSPVADGSSEYQQQIIKVFNNIRNDTNLVEIAKFDKAQELGQTTSIKMAPEDYNISALDLNSKASYSINSIISQAETELNDSKLVDETYAAEAGLITFEQEKAHMANSAESGQRATALVERIIAGSGNIEPARNADFKAKRDELLRQRAESSGVSYKDYSADVYNVISAENEVRAQEGNETLVRMAMGVDGINAIKADIVRNSSDYAKLVREFSKAHKDPETGRGIEFSALDVTEQNRFLASKQSETIDIKEKYLAMLASKGVIKNQNGLINAANDAGMGIEEFLASGKADRFLAKGHTRAEIENVAKSNDGSISRLAIANMSLEIFEKLRSQIISDRTDAASTIFKQERKAIVQDTVKDRIASGNVGQASVIPNIEKMNENERMEFSATQIYLSNSIREDENSDILKNILANTSLVNEEYILNQIASYTSKINKDFDMSKVVNENGKIDKTKLLENVDNKYINGYYNDNYQMKEVMTSIGANDLLLTQNTENRQKYSVQAMENNENIEAEVLKQMFKNEFKSYRQQLLVYQVGAKVITDNLVISNPARESILNSGKSDKDIQKELSRLARVNIEEIKSKHGDNAGAVIESTKYKNLASSMGITNETITDNSKLLSKQDFYKMVITKFNNGKVEEIEGRYQAPEVRERHIENEAMKIIAKQKDIKIDNNNVDEILLDASKARYETKKGKVRKEFVPFATDTIDSMRKADNPSNFNNNFYNQVLQNISYSKKMTLEDYKKFAMASKFNSNAGFAAYYGVTNIKEAASQFHTNNIDKSTQNNDYGMLFDIKKNSPQNSAYYDNWNNTVRMQINAVKRGRGDYAGLTKDEKNAKVEELKGNLIFTDSKPANYRTMNDAEKLEFDRRQKILKHTAIETGTPNYLKSNERLNIISSDAHRDVSAKYGNSFKFDNGASTEITRSRHLKDLQNYKALITEYNTTKKDLDFNGSVDEITTKFLGKQKTTTKVIEKMKSTENIRERQVILEKAMGQRYKVISSRVAKDMGTNHREFLEERGIGETVIRYKSATKKFGDTSSKLFTNNLQATPNSKVNPAISGRNYMRKDEQAVIMAQMKKDNYDQVMSKLQTTNLSFKGSAAEYSALIKQMFGQMANQMYSKSYGLFSEYSAVSIQQRGLVKVLDSMMYQEERRMKYPSNIIPASRDSSAQYVGMTFNNGKTHKQLELDKKQAEIYSKSYNIVNNQKNSNSFDKVYAQIPQTVKDRFEKTKTYGNAESFNALSQDERFKKLEAYLKAQYTRTTNIVNNNSMLNGGREKLNRFSAMSYKKDEVSTVSASGNMQKAIMNTNPVYKTLVEKYDADNNRYLAELQHKETLTKELERLRNSDSTSKKEMAEIARVYSELTESKIRLEVLNKSMQSSKANKEAFEYAFADRQISGSRASAGALPINSKVSAFDNYEFYKQVPRADGTMGYEKINSASVDGKQIEMMSKTYITKFRSQLDMMLRSDMMDALLKAEIDSMRGQFANSLKDTIYISRKIDIMMYKKQRQFAQENYDQEVQIGKNKSMVNQAKILEHKNLQGDIKQEAMINKNVAEIQVLRDRLNKLTADFTASLRKQGINLKETLPTDTTKASQTANNQAEDTARKTKGKKNKNGASVDYQDLNSRVSNLESKMKSSSNASSSYGGDFSELESKVDRNKHKADKNFDRIVSETKQAMNNYHNEYIVNNQELLRETQRTNEILQAQQPVVPNEAKQNIRRKVERHQRNTVKPRNNDIHRNH